MGALGASLVALILQELPTSILLPLILIASIVFGGIWGAIPGYLKAKWNVNEFVNTVMMNYIAIYLVNFLVSGPIREERVFSNPQSNSLLNKLDSKSDSTNTP